jgi:hypothetical protein
MAYSLILTRLRENRLKAQCHAAGAEYSVIIGMLSRMLRWGPELDVNARLEFIRTDDEQDCDLSANKAAIELLQEAALEFNLSHREAAFMLLDTWSGPAVTFPDDYRGKGWKFPVAVCLENEEGEIISTMVI